MVAKQWFEANEQYTNDRAIPEDFIEYGTLSLVRVAPSGKTESGWGAKDFVENRDKGRFDPQRAVRNFNKFQQPFAFVMRSVPFVCIDLDGKNNGVAGVAQLLRLPETLAERSKSGNGYHLIYRVPMARWNALRGFDDMEDHNGIIPGVDVRGTGVMYHYPGQMWNNLVAADLPMSLYALLTRAQEIRHTTRLTRNGTAGLDEDELVIIHDRLKTQLEQPAKVGTRNQRLFAIGSQMAAAEYRDWELALTERGYELGLEAGEVHEIVQNILKYGK